MRNPFYIIRSGDLRILDWFFGVIEVTNGLIRILTLGYVGTTWDMDYLCWKVTRRLRKK